MKLIVKCAADWVLQEIDVADWQAQAEGMNGDDARHLASELEVMGTRLIEAAAYLEARHTQALYHAKAMAVAAKRGSKMRRILNYPRKK